MNTKGLGNPPAAVRNVVVSTADLSRGDHIEAAYRGTVVHRGKVTEITPRPELFWITDYLSGSRRLLDVTEFDITRLSDPAGGKTVRHR